MLGGNRSGSAEQRRLDRTIELGIDFQVLSQAAEIDGHFFDYLVSLVYVLSQCFSHDAFEFGGSTNQVLGNCRGLLFNYCHHYVGGSFTHKRWMSGNHFIEHNSQTPDVGSFIHRNAASLFRRHVCGCAHHCAW